MTRLFAAFAVLAACAGTRPQPPPAPVEPQAAAAAKESPGAQPPAATGRAPQREKVSFVQGPAGRLRVSDGGEGGVPVVFVHGLGSEWSVWREQLDHFRKTRRAVAYDQRGHGESDPPRDGDYQIPSLADDLEAVVEGLHIDRFFLVAHSMAGVVASAYQGKHPERLAGVVYVDAVGTMKNIPRDTVEALEKQESSPDFGTKQMVDTYDKMVSDSARPETRKSVLDMASRFSPRAFASIRRSMVRYDPMPDVARYQGPKLAIEVRGNEFPGMASHLPGMRRETIGNVSHWLMLDDPASLDKALDAFFAQAR